ncbi:hypothetical protein SAMD00019534_008390 [Acytostelium subglobosum LB1]|uniref:hypothetical protein n=1 Tax=Acytostelium subglobosum LB1 TaxID=1410327 RepID=UPI000644F063|nr:hypothetical protein SAMD00019534_008390 [Acytostelium subglobosum LB1]GAM17664.1 hypothetical protein SAMD00019534_008390 [Acytostelium subglobosum LB1]|eukprot:XP_012758260.1 hypothetical protein SAMD00019534_008390 [Acytostelium subglobosum LB1]
MDNNINSSNSDSNSSTTTNSDEIITTSHQYQPTHTYTLPKNERYRFYSLATDITGDLIAIGCERNLLIANLNNNNNTFSGAADTSVANVKKVSLKEVECNLLQWCSDRSQSQLIATSSSNNIHLWDIRKETLEHTFAKAHLRSIASMSWNNVDTNLLASSSGDNLVKIWDRREDKTSRMNSIDTNSFITHVAWNPHSSSMLASSHHGVLKIWDIRKFGSPLTSWNSHVGTARSLDWHSTNKSTIMVCGSDHCIRVWDASPPNPSIKTFQTGHLCTKAMFLPFSKHYNVASFSTKSFNSNISIWAGNGDSPMISLTGHQDAMIDFSWRVHDNQHSLVSISKDCTIKQWTFSDERKEIIDTISSALIDQPQRRRNSWKTLVPDDLSQELQVIANEKYDNIIVEKTSLTDRLCIINIENRKVIVVISLPSLYPSAPPCFEILTKDPTSNKIKIVLKKEFDHLSHEFMDLERNNKTKKPFLYKILKKYSQNHSNNAESFNEISSVMDSPNLIQRLGNSGKSTSSVPTLRLSLQDDDLSGDTSNQSSSVDPLLEQYQSPSIKSRATEDHLLTQRTSPRAIPSTTSKPPKSNNPVFYPSFVPMPPNYHNASQSVTFEMYHVKPTDTLTGIALQFSMPRDILMQTNRLFSDKLMPGAVLWVYRKKDQQHTLSGQQDHSSSSMTQSAGNLPSITVSSGTNNHNNNSNNNNNMSDNNGKPRSRAGSTVNINNLFKPMKEEVEMAFKTLETNSNMSSPSTATSTTTSGTKPSPKTDSTEKRSFASFSRFTQITKDKVVKEELICYMKSKQVQGTLTLTPYQFIFQSNEKSPTQIYTDYNQIISCKYFPNHAEWLAHLSKDWKKEQYVIQKKNQEKDSEYDNFIQAEITKLNEMGEEMKTINVNNEKRKVLVFPCIYVLIHKDKFIQTLFFRGVDEESVHKCFAFLKQSISEIKDGSGGGSGSPLVHGVSPLMNGNNSTNHHAAPPPIPFSLDSSPVLSSARSSFDQDNYSPSPKLKMLGNNKFSEQVLLTADLFKKLRHYLPIHVQASDIELKYNSTNDGVSFNTFYRKMRNVPQSILLIKDNGGYVFGAYCSAEVKPRTSYYGNGETFLFKIAPEFQVFKWTKENDLFLYTSLEYLAIGGGSMFGLWMDTDFLHGYSGPCETFKNDCLSFASDFNPIVVEFWAIQ